MRRRMTPATMPTVRLSSGTAVPGVCPGVDPEPAGSPLAPDPTPDVLVVFDGDTRRRGGAWEGSGTRLEVLTAPTSRRKLVCARCEEAIVHVKHADRCAHPAPPRNGKEEDGATAESNQTEMGPRPPFTPGECVGRDATCL